RPRTPSSSPTAATDARRRAVPAPGPPRRPRARPPRRGCRAAPTTPPAPPAPARPGPGRARPRAAPGPPACPGTAPATPPPALPPDLGVEAPRVQLTAEPRAHRRGQRDDPPARGRAALHATVAQAGRRAAAVHHRHEGGAPAALVADGAPAPERQVRERDAAG